MSLPKFCDFAPDIFTPAVVVEYPGYVYITVRINKNPRERNVYWHLVDPDFSLLELGFEFVSGRLSHISVPLYKGNLAEDLAVLPIPQKGEPTFDLKGMGFSPQFQGAVPEVIKCSGRVTLTRSGPDLDIRLAEAPIECAFCCQNQVVFGFSQSCELNLIRLVAKADSLK